MRTPWFAAVALLVGLAQAAGAAEGKPKSVEPSDYLDFVFVASDRPVLLRLHVRNNTKPYSTAWEDYLQKLHAYLDRNGDGALDRAEAERAPSLQFLQFHLQGAIGLPYQGSKGQMGQFDANKDGKVSLAEFQEFYRRAGFAPLQFFSNSNRANTESATNTFYNRLDNNKDGKLSAQEMARAEAALLHFDLDENEMLTAAELMPGGEDNNPFGRQLNSGQTGPNAEMGFYEIKQQSVDNLSTKVLGHYDKDKNSKLSQKEIGLDKLLFDQLDASHDGQLDAKEFTAFFRRDADLELIARIGGQEMEGVIVNVLRKTGLPAAQAIRTDVFNPTRRAMPLADRVKRTDASTVAFALGDARIGLSVSDQQFRSFPRQFFEQQFRQADAGKKGVLDRKQAMTTQFFGQIFDFVDRNGDDKVTQKELKAYLDLQSEGAGCRLQLTITDEGRSLFEVLDENGDGRLSLRELRASWSRMKPLVPPSLPPNLGGKEGGGGLSRLDISRRLDLSVGQSQRNGPVIQTVFRRVAAAGGQKAAPMWFQKMDRNQDGDVSPREFLGSDEDFRKLDTDGDGLISASEARQFEERLKKEKVTKR